MRTLDEENVQIGRAEAVTSAERLCAKLASTPTMDLSEAALWVLLGNPETGDLTPVGAGSFIGASVAAYCPERGQQVGIEGLE